MTNKILKKLHEFDIKQHNKKNKSNLSKYKSDIKCSDKISEALLKTDNPNQVLTNALYQNDFFSLFSDCYNTKELFSNILEAKILAHSEAINKAIDHVFKMDSYQDFIDNSNEIIFNKEEGLFFIIKKEKITDEQHFIIEKTGKDFREKINVKFWSNGESKHVCILSKQKNNIYSFDKTLEFLDLINGLCCHFSIDFKLNIEAIDLI